MKNKFLNVFIIFCLFLTYAYFSLTSFAADVEYESSNISNQYDTNYTNDSGIIRGEYIEEDRYEDEEDVEEDVSFLTGFKDFVETILSFIPEPIRKYIPLIIITLVIMFIIYGSFQASKEIRREHKIKEFINENDTSESEVIKVIRENNNKNNEAVKKFKDKVHTSIKTNNENNSNNSSNNTVIDNKTTKKNNTKKNKLKLDDNFIDDIKVKFRKKNNNKFVNDNVLDDIERREKKTNKKR